MQIWRLPGWLAGWLARKLAGVSVEAVGLLESLQTGSLETRMKAVDGVWMMGWLAGWRWIWMQWMVDDGCCVKDGGWKIGG